MTELRVLKSGIKYWGELETDGWLNWSLVKFDPAMTDDDILTALDYFAYYQGPGLPFSSPAHVRRHKTRPGIALAYQRGGYDC